MASHFHIAVLLFISFQTVTVSGQDHAPSKYFSLNAFSLPGGLVSGFDCGDDLNAFKCVDCNRTVFCTRLPNGTVAPFLTEECSGGSFCNEDQPFCRLDVDTCSVSAGEYRHTCTDVGVYPHPSTCSEYFVCAAGDGEEIPPLRCPGGFGFDPATSRCTVFPAVGCASPVRPCTEAGKFPVAGNRRLYSECRLNGTELAVHVRYCTLNWIFVNGTCVIPTATQGLTKEGKCISSGSYYVPNCKQYNLCYGPNWIPSLRNCQAGYVFDPEQQTCVPYTCPR